MASFRVEMTIVFLSFILYSISIFYLLYLNFIYCISYSVLYLIFFSYNY